MTFADSKCEIIVVSQLDDKFLGGLSNIFFVVLLLSLLPDLTRRGITLQVQLLET